jgi:lysophospholipase L1-like esterase
MWKKLLAMTLGTLGGVVLIIVAWSVWDIVHPPPHALDAAERGELRRKLDENPTAIVMYDEATSYRYKPNFHGYRSRPTHLGDRNRVDFPHITNSLGLIGPDEISADRRPKILLLGDSVTYGMWVDPNDTFAVRMQKQTGASCQLLVGACEGWSTKQELAFFDAYLRGIDWRAVVLVFCLNDLVDFEWTFDANTGAIKLTEEITSVGTGGTKTNQTVGGLKLALLRRTLSADPKTAPLANQVNTALWAWEEGRWTHYLQHTLTPFFERANRPPMAIVMSPTEGQLQAFARGADPAQAMYPQLRMQAFCAQQKIACIDLSEAFAGSTAEELASYFLDDLHFSEAGHGLVARFLWPRIKAMVDRPPS